MHTSPCDEKPVVTIVVPIYNSARFLDECLKSIQNSLYRDFECILVDNSSSDRSSQICKAYAEKDRRFLYIRQENNGISSARNRGIDEARGEYVVFIDSDDYVGEKYLSDLLDAVSEENILLISDYQPFTPEKEIYRSFPSAFTVRFSEKAPDDKIVSLLLEYRVFTPTCRLYRKQILDDFHLRFDETLKSAEDFDFNFRYLQYMDGVSYIPSVQYFYRTDYKHLKTQFIRSSDIKSAHIMARGMLTLAKKMGASKSVMDRIDAFTAEKYLYNRLPRVFAPHNKVNDSIRKQAFRSLRADPVYQDALRRGFKHLSLPFKMKMAAFLDCYFVWKLYFSYSARR